MNNKLWVVKEPQDPVEVKSIADSLNIAEVLASLLVYRNIKTFAQAKKFFRPSLEDLHDPFLMNGMAEAANRVIHAITENEKILVYGDYDVDGTCSTALMYMFLKTLGANVDYYIPKRLEEGYGISVFGVDYANSIKTSLLISVDCGITAVAEIDYANTFGIDVIICDHHQPKEKLPAAFAVLDPLKPECNYPFKYLSGAGVAFKLAQGVAEKIGKRNLPLKYLDLVALAGAADIVSLTDENRILVKEGLDQVNLSPRPGIKALIQISRIEPGTLSSGQIVFTLAPRINAVGRMGDAATAVQLLVTESDTEAMRLARMLEEDNIERKKIDEETLNHAEAIIKKNEHFDEEKAIILHNDDWHPGVIGIVASRIVEKYYKPTIMLTTSDGIAKGSARSIPNFNIYEALHECEDLLVHYGGHEAAAGLAIEINKLDEFRVRFNAVVKKNMDEKIADPIVSVDSIIKLSEITPKFIRIIDQFAPFGPANLRPVFMVQNVECSGMARGAGAGGKHLLFNVRQKGCDKVFDVVGFNFGECAAKMNNGQKTFSMVFSIDKKNKDGKSIPQLRVRDIKFN
jgi:single-stranded-DNA-specific exonuclease